MSQADFVQPLLNTPTDPFEQQRVEEERRYREAQFEKLRQQKLRDYELEQRLRNDAAKERLQMELDARGASLDKELRARGKAGRRDLRMRDKFARAKLEDERNYGRQQSQAMAGEIPDLRLRIQTKRNQLRDLENSLLIGDPSVRVKDNDAYARTVAFNSRFLDSIRSGDGMQVLPAAPESALGSTQEMFKWLGSQSQNMGDNGQRVLENYLQMADQERTAIRSRKSAEFDTVNTGLRQLQGRMDAIIKGTMGGDFDYSAYDSGIMTPSTPAPTDAPLNDQDILDAANRTLNSAGGAGPFRDMGGDGSPGGAGSPGSQMVADDRTDDRSRAEEFTEMITEAPDFFGHSGSVNALDPILREAEEQASNGDIQGAEARLDAIEEQLAESLTALTTQQQSLAQEGMGPIDTLMNPLGSEQFEAGIQQDYEAGLDAYIDGLNKLNESRTRMGMEPIKVPRVAEYQTDKEGNRVGYSLVPALGEQDLKFNESTGLFERTFNAPRLQTFTESEAIGQGMMSSSDMSPFGPGIDTTDPDYIPLQYEEGLMDSTSTGVPAYGFPPGL